MPEEQLELPFGDPEPRSGEDGPNGPRGEDKPACEEDKA